MRENALESGNGHARRREEAYRQAAGVHGSAQRVETEASAFFAEVGDAEAAARHARNAEGQGELADADDARAAPSAGAMT